MPSSISNWPETGQNKIILEMEILCTPMRLYKSNCDEKTFVQLTVTLEDTPFFPVVGYNRKHKVRIMSHTIN